MPNRTVSFAVLLFSFAGVLLGLKPINSNTVISINLSLGFSQTVGVIALIFAMIFMIASFKERWSTAVIDFVTNRSYTYYPGFILFWGVYTVTYIKGLALITPDTVPHWMFWSYFVIGFIFFLAIPGVSLIQWPKFNKKNREKDYQLVGGE